MIDKTSKEQTVNLYGEKQKRDFVYVTDVANAFVGVVETSQNFEIYNGGPAVGRRIEDLLNLVKEYLQTLPVEYGDFRSILYNSVVDISKL